jgi:hypothetical protein
VLRLAEGGDCCSDVIGRRNRARVECIPSAIVATELTDSAMPELRNDRNIVGFLRYFAAASARTSPPFDVEHVRR